MCKQIFTIIITCLLITSCGRKREILEIEEAAIAKVVGMHYSNASDFETMTSRLRLKYQDEEKTQSVTVSFRMQKDSTIWISAQLLGFPLAKALITKDRVSYYEKVSQTYFDGDYSLLSKWLGTPLDYEKLQNLLLGQTIYDLREDNYVLTESLRGYQLELSGEFDAVKKMFLLDAQNYKAIAQQLSQERENRYVTVTYPKYQRIDDQPIPENIKIIANSEGKNTQIEISFQTVNFNDPVSFPFEIPSGYEEIQIE